METILSFEDVSYSYLDGSSTVTILDKANYDFEKGKIYAIVGASGSGKTTTIVLAGGLDKPKEGKVNFKGSLICFFKTLFIILFIINIAIIDKIILIPLFIKPFLNIPSICL